MCQPDLDHFLAQICLTRDPPADFAAFTELQWHVCSILSDIGQTNGIIQLHILFDSLEKANRLEYITKFDVYIPDVEHVCGEYKERGECKRRWTHTFICGKTSVFMQMIYTDKDSQR